MRISPLTRPMVMAAAVAVIGGFGAIAPAPATASSLPGTAVRSAPRIAHVAITMRPALPAGERYVCPLPTRPGQMTCMSIIAARPHQISGSAPAFASNSYSPSDLRNAYKIATQAARDGRGRTVAIVDAYRDPKAVSDLNRYRSHFHLGACTIANRCLRILNENGRASPLPMADPQWAIEESLDLDMVSAICPRCHILLVEANSDSPADLGRAEDTAIAKGARYVSNSWSQPEFFGQDSYDRYFNHPGDVLVFASGDSGYGPAYPADLPYVTAAGGTSLRHARNRRGWSETVWGSSAVAAAGTGSGCSGLEPKPSWQRKDANAPDGCLLRTENDVSAVADPNTGVLIYDSYFEPGLFEAGGTSAATPIITAIYALAGTPTRGSYPAEYPYLHARRLFDVTSGTNGACERFRRYLCHGERGYDGPTGLGTPDGTGAFTDNSAHRVALLDPGTQDVAAGTGIRLTISGLDTRRGSPLHWSAIGLPSGVTIHPVSNSTNGRITGRLPRAAHSYQLTVSAKDGTATGTTHFAIVAVPPLSAPNRPPAGRVRLYGTNLCLDGGTDTTGQAVRVRTCGNRPSQDWTFTAAGGPNDTGTLKVAHECMGLIATHAVLDKCTGARKDQWAYLGFGALWNPATGGCLNLTSVTGGTQANTAKCTFVSSQSWNLPAGPLVEGAGALCLNNPSGAQVDVGTCNSSQPTQLWALRGDGTISDHLGKCLAANGPFSLTKVTVESCDSANVAQRWEPGPGAQLISLGSGKCLADRGNGGPGTAVVQNDCYGDAGEVWGLN